MAQKKSPLKVKQGETLKGGNLLEGIKKNFSKLVCDLREGGTEERKHTQKAKRLLRRPGPWTLEKEKWTQTKGILPSPQVTVLNLTEHFRPSGGIKRG